MPAAADVKENEDGTRTAYTYGAALGPMTEEELRDITEIPECWETKHFTSNKWDANTGEGNLVSLWQAKGTFAPPRDSVAGLDSMIERLESIAPESRQINHARANSGDEKVLLEISPSDLHLGLYTSAPYTGMDYNLDIASELFLGTIAGLVQKSSAFRPAEILLLIGNDFLHVDGFGGTTTKGTPMQDTAGIFPEMFDVGIECLIQGIDMLAEIAPVRVVAIPGNHDFTVCMMLGRILEAWYRNQDHITVDRRYAPTKYVRWGVNLLGFNHGRVTQKMLKELPLIMAADQPQDWGETKFREWHLGDKHRTNNAMERQGVRVRHLPSLAATDLWHDEMMFRNNVRAAEAFLWGDRSGYIGQFSSNVDPKTSTLL